MTTPAFEPLTGHCQCGRIAFVVRQPPRDTHYCHCRMCRRAVGNAFATLVWVLHADVDWLKARPTLYRSSPIAQRGFCPTCGSPVCLAYDGADQVALMLGLFDDPGDLVPTHHYGIEARLPWVDVGGRLPGRPTAADPRP